MHTKDPQARREISYPACDQCGFTNNPFHGDPVGGKYIDTLGFQKPSGDELESYGWGGLQLVFRFIGEPEGLVDALSAGSEKTVWLLIDFGMLLFSEGPIHASVG